MARRWSLFCRSRFAESCSTDLRRSRFNLTISTLRWSQFVDVDHDGNGPRALPAPWGDFNLFVVLTLIMMVWTKSTTSTLRWFQLLGGVDVKSGLLILGVFTPSTSQQKHLKTQEHPPPPPPVPHIPYNANTRKIKVHQFSFTIQFVPHNDWLDSKRTLNLVDKASMQYLGTTERASPRSDDHPLLNGTGEVNCLCLLSYILYLYFCVFIHDFFQDIELDSYTGEVESNEA